MAPDLRFCMNWRALGCTRFHSRCCPECCPRLRPVGWHPSLAPVSAAPGAGGPVEPEGAPPRRCRAAGTVSYVNPLSWLDRVGADRTEKGQVLYVLYVIIAVLVIVFLLKVLGVI